MRIDGLRERVACVGALLGAQDDAVHRAAARGDETVHECAHQRVGWHAEKACRRADRGAAARSIRAGGRRGEADETETEDP